MARAKQTARKLSQGTVRGGWKQLATMAARKSAPAYGHKRNTPSRRVQVQHTPRGVDHPEEGPLCSLSKGVLKNSLLVGFKLSSFDSIEEEEPVTTATASKVQNVGAVFSSQIGIRLEREPVIEVEEVKSMLRSPEEGGQLVIWRDESGNIWMNEGHLSEAVHVGRHKHTLYES